MPTLYDAYKDPPPWDKDLPVDLIPPIKHIRKTFDTIHWEYAQVTEKLCYWQLHPETSEDEIKEYLKPLQHLKSIAGRSATERFVELLQMKTAPGTFKAFFDLYMESISVPALAFFRELSAVGKANEQRLGIPHLEWAQAQIQNMIRSKVHLIRSWVQNVCDKQAYDPQEDVEEQIFWRKWQAPTFLIMKPSRYATYDAARLWERNAPDVSSGWLDSFATHYVLHVEGKLEKLAGLDALELAKRPYSKPQSSEVSPPRDVVPRVESHPDKQVSSRREAQKAATAAKHQNWQREYRSLRESNPDRSDVWYSLKISRMAIGMGSSPETIRRQMKQK